MNKNKKFLFFSLTLLLIIVSLSVISATDDNVSQTTLSNADTDVTDTITTKEDNIKSSDFRDIKDELKNNNNDSDRSKQNKNKTNKNIKKATTHIITNSTVTKYFDKDKNYKLSDLVSEGDTLDIQGEISGIDSNKFSMIINKPVNVISSTKNAYIDLNTTCADLLGSDPGAMFAVTTGADYTNITGINLHNTQLWVSAVNHVTFDNISAVVNGSHVGGGVGQTSIRDGSEYITVRNSYFYTCNNGGSSTFVLAYANYCTIDNITVETGSGAGNAFYFTTFNAGIPEGVLYNSFNNVTNCKIGGEGTGVGKHMVLSGHNNTITNTISTAFELQSGLRGREECGNFTLINNTFTTGMVGDIPNSTYINNTLGLLEISKSVAINNNIKRSLILIGVSTIINNTIGRIDVRTTKASNSVIANNTITGTVNIKRGNITLENNTINSQEELALNVMTNNNIIRNNNITARSKAGDDVVKFRNKQKNTYENNSPEKGETYNVTDEIYDQYFDENGNIKSTIKDFSTLNLIGTFNNKNFTINKKVTITGINATLNNATVKIIDKGITIFSNITINTTNPNAIILNTEGNLISNVTLIHESSNPTIIINSDKNTINTTNIQKTIKSNENNNINIIDIHSSDNIITQNNITAKTDIKNTTITTIRLEADQPLEINEITFNTINITADKTVGIIPRQEHENLTIEKNNITLNAITDAKAIIIDKVHSFKVTNNNINISSNQDAEGIMVTLQNKPSFIRYNNITIISTNAVGININVKGTEIIEVDSNNINANVKEKILGFKLNNYNNLNNGIGLPCLNITSQHDLDDNVGILLENVKNTNFNRFLENIINATPIKIINGTNLRISCGFDSPIQCMRPVCIINSTNITLAHLNITTSVNCSTIHLINSSNNNLSELYLKVNNVTSGESTILEDENSENNTISDIYPELYLLNNETYNQMFDKNGKINITSNLTILSLPEIYLTSDLIGVTIEFDKPFQLINNKNYTLYNSTIILNGSYNTNRMDLKNLNIHNVNKTTIILNINADYQSRLNITNAYLNITGDVPAIILSFNEDMNETYKIPEVYLINSTTILNGENPIFIKSTGKNMSYNTIQKINLNKGNITINSTNSIHFGDIKNTRLNVDESNILINSKNIMLLSNITEGSFNLNKNNITLIGDNIKITRNQTSGNLYLNTNIFNITSKNSVNLVEIPENENSTVYSIIIGNTFNVKVETPLNGRLPLISTPNRNIQNNIINITDSLNQSILGSEAVIGNTSGNTPNAMYHTFITITNNTTSIKYNQDGNITIRLEGLYHENINGTMNITADGKTYNVNDTQITVPIHPKSMKLPIMINYIDENGVYQTLENHVETLNISRGDANLKIIVNHKVLVGESITITAILSDNGKLIQDGFVAFKLNGCTLKDANGNRIKVRIINGIATLTYTIPSNYAAKDYLLTAVFSNENYDRIEVNQTVTIIPSNIFIQPTSLYYENGKLVIKADIKDAITNKNIDIKTKVSLKINGKTFIDRMIVEDGIITVAHDIKLNNGIKTLTIVSGQNSKYNTNRISINFMLQNTPVKQSKNSTQITTNDNLKAKI